MESLDRAIGQHPFLRTMRSQYITRIAAGAKLVEFDSNQVIFRESDIAYQFYLIEQGCVVLESYVPDDGFLTIQTIGPGGVLGWSWLFPPYFLHFQARALERTKAIWLDATHLLVLCEQDHDFGYEVMKRVSQLLIERLHATRHQLLDLHRLRPPG